MTNQEMYIQCGWVGSYQLNSNTGDGGHCPDCGADVQDFDKREYDNIFAIPFGDKLKNYGMYLLRVAGVCAFAVLVIAVFSLADGIADDVAKVVGGAR